MGNARISFARNSAGALEITDANDYYPFGMNHLKTGNAFFGNASYKNYKYNGKELQESGMYDYGARFYMPDLGRWGVIDPLVEVSRRWSPYNYVLNNPISHIDPDGRLSQSFIDELWNKSGNNTTWTNDGNDNFSDGNGNNVSDSGPGPKGSWGGVKWSSFINNWNFEDSVEFYQSHYNFSENRVVDARELEGLEKVQVNEEKPILDRAKNGINTFFNGVTNFFNEKLNLSREAQISKNPSASKELITQRNSAKAAALGEMGLGLSDAMKGSAYALGEALDKGGEYTSTAALTIAPATEGASLSLVGPAEIVSNVGWGIKFGVDFTDGKYSDLITEGSKKIIGIGIGKIGNGLLDKTFKANPGMTKTEKAIHETVVGGTATVVSKSAEKVVDEKTKKK